ncbi:MAG TPA: c-type cytochrome [Chthoniobacterales bacterium]|nr:c-type cytochrome [Chthoniobacterales bacterium]
MKHATRPAERLRDAIDYHDAEDVQKLHAAIRREKRDPRAGPEPLSLWLIGLHAIAVLFAGFYVGRYSGDFSSDSLDPVAGQQPQKALATGAQSGQQVTELSPAARGKKIYAANCATCHQATGLGVAGQYPPLAGSEHVTGGTRRLGMILLKGLHGPMKVKGVQYGSAVMQPWEKTLTDAKIADVLTYIRSEWGNNAPGVAPEGVAALRKELAGRSESFTEADLEALGADGNLLGGEGAADAAATPDQPAIIQVSIRGMRFVSANLEVRKGDTIEWKNDDLTPHTATSKAFDSGSIEPDKSWRHTFTDGGEFPYICTFHPDMKGIVIVR